MTSLFVFCGFDGPLQPGLDQKKKKKKKKELPQKLISPNLLSERCVSDL